MRQILLLATLITSTSLFAQGLLNEITPNQLTFNETGTMRSVKTINVTKKYNPFLFENWSNGYIRINDGTLIHRDKLHYNLENSTINLESSPGNLKEFYQLDNQTLKGFGIYDLKTRSVREFFKIQKSQFENPEDLHAEYFEIISDQQSDQPLILKELYKKEIKINVDRKGLGGYAGATPVGSGSRLKQFEAYYVLKNGKYVKTKLSKSKLLKTFSDQKNQVNKFIRENRLDCKNPYEVLRLVRFYNSL
ncbi:hypothetical protein [Aureivirga marina]|uniref:hypothetical protein n=1 Tax=Aureivirga marina TaxID=1182451 RepID=UPI0018CA7EB0|nr:hypothetical protein [Aureivirga marina]